jgi:hypothetical protein
VNADDYYQLVAAIDDARPRSSSGFGPSGFYGPECKTTRSLRGDQAVNEVDKWAAMRGTAIHAAFAEAVQHLGPVEVPLEHEGLRGNADHLPDNEPDVVVDLKTGKWEKIAKAEKEGVSLAHLAQINWYCRAAGRTRWRIVYAPVDRGRKHWRVFEGDYDEHLVDKALGWLAGLLLTVRRGEVAEPSMTAVRFCADYCEFYDPTGKVGCRSKSPVAPAVTAFVPVLPGSPQEVAA